MLELASAFHLLRRKLLPAPLELLPDQATSGRTDIGTGTEEAGYGLADDGRYRPTAITFGLSPIIILITGLITITAAIGGRAPKLGSECEGVYEMMPFRTA